MREARQRGVLLYSGTGHADGTNGDTILLGPPFIVTDDELRRIATVLADAIEATTDALTAAPAVSGGAATGSG